MNVVLIYADDLGYGDVEFLNKACKIPTPHLNKLAERGIIFTDAHASDTICSPSRYGILTGRYSWRTRLKKGNPKLGDQPWISAHRDTMASMLAREGYDTAAIGKWGLGSDWAAAARPERRGHHVLPQDIDYSKPVHSGRCVGFSYDDVHLWYTREYYTTDRYKRYNEKHMWEETDGGRWYFENGMSEGGDPVFEDFDMEEAQLRYIKRTVEYIDSKGGTARQAKFNQRDGAPFFIYYAPHIPHFPHVPAKPFIGKSRCGIYGDFVMELDWAVGEITTALERNGLLDDTMIIFTSDNGPERQCYEYPESFGHYSMGDLRGIKRDVWEGGHRTPFVVSYPKLIKKGRTCNRMVSQLDIIRTVADMLGAKLPKHAAEDSFSFASEIDATCRESKPRRDFMVHHTANDKYALRKGDWILVEGSSGDCGSQEPEWFRKQRGVVPHQEEVELFNLKTDPQQLQNLYASEPERARDLLDELLRLKKSPTLEGH